MRIYPLLAMAAVLLAALAVAGCVPEATPADGGSDRPLPQSLREYQESIDYSCASDADCAIKDVGNCCGAYPRCVNRDAETSPRLVVELCKQEGMVSVCGFPAISSCACVSGACVGRQ